MLALPFSFKGDPLGVCLKLKRLLTFLLLLCVLLGSALPAYAAVSITTSQPSMSGTQYNYRHTFDLSEIPSGDVLEFVVYSKSSSTGNMVATSNKKIYNGGSSGSSFFQWSKPASVERWVIAYQAAASLSTNDRRQHKVWTCHIKTDQSYDCGSGVVTPPDPSSPGGGTSLNITAVPAANGNVTLSWSPVDGAVGYQVLQDGQVVENLTPNTSVTLPDHGEVRVIAFDQHSQVITSEMMQLGDSFPPDPGTDPGTDPWAECATAICNCIKELMPALEQIESNTGGMLNQLAQMIPIMNSMDGKLSSIRDVLDDFRNEFKTNQTYPIKSVQDYNLPTLEDNKPPMREGVYRDNNVYFTDKGDDALPPALPVAPEPVEQWKDSGGNLIDRQAPGQQQPNLTRDPQPSMAPAQTRSPSQSRQPAQSKEPSQTRAPAQTRSPDLERDQVLQPSPKMTRQPALQQDKTHYEPRTRMENGVMLP